MRGAGVQLPPIPNQEFQRIAELRALRILDTPADDRFDRLTRLARRVLRVPIALISLVDGERQWFKSRVGLDIRETPRTASFCAHAICRPGLMLVRDATDDPRFRDNPLVTGSPWIRFYAGHPVHGPGGWAIGTLCVMDHRPRDMSEADLQALTDLANIAEDQFVVMALASTDEMTGVANRRGFMSAAGQIIRLCRRLGTPANLLYFDLDNLKAINDTLGHAAGDRAIIALARGLRNTFRESDIVARVGGDEFCVLAGGSVAIDVGAVLERTREAVRVAQSQECPELTVEYSVGHVAFDPRRHDGISSLMVDADRLMYAHKQRMRAGPAPVPAREG